MISVSKTIRSAVLALLVCTTNALCQSDELKALVHSKVEFFNDNPLSGAGFDEVKKSMGAYDKNDVANALLADLDVDRGSQELNSLRDHIVGTLYKQLDAPLRNVCEQLKQAALPEKKAQLMWAIPDSTAPELVALLLDQIKDKRVCAEFRGILDTGPKPPGMRVCDMAMNLLTRNLRHTPGTLEFEMPIAQRDQRMENELKNLRSDGLIKQ